MQHNCIINGAITADRRSITKNRTDNATTVQSEHDVILDTVKAVIGLVREFL